MNSSEKVVARYLMERGFEVYRSGWPDFLAVDGSTGAAHGVEVKSSEFKLRPEQATVHLILGDAGLPVVTVHVPPPSRIDAEAYVARHGLHVMAYNGFSEDFPPMLGGGALDEDLEWFVSECPYCGCNGAHDRPLIEYERDDASEGEESS